MFERELTLYKFNYNYLRMLMEDFEESDMRKVAFEGGNPPVWILGHLAVGTDYAARMLGIEPTCPREWHKQFAPGTKPADMQEPLPTKAELMATIEDGYRRTSEAAPGASAEVMNAPHQIELLRPSNLKTNGDVMAHLMCTHIAFHLAQLSACRRASGKPPFV